MLNNLILVSKNQLHVGGIESMVPSVTHIAVNTSGTRLATGGDSGISIWFKASTGMFVCLDKKSLFDSYRSRDLAIGKATWSTPTISRQCIHADRSDWYALARE